MNDIKGLLTVFERNPSWKKMISLFFPEGPRCPYCGKVLTGKRALASFHDFKRTFCQSCSGKFSPAVGTPIYLTRWMPEEFIRLLVVTGLLEYQPKQVAELLDKSPQSVLDMLEKINISCPQLLQSSRSSRISGGSSAVQHAEK